MTIANAAAADPVLRGLDHIPVVVADLERAAKDFEALGFVLKPGRAHANGIRNAHAKFPDGTEIELITAPAAVDELTSEYADWLRHGDGPAFVGFYTRQMNEGASRISDLGSPTTLADGLLTFPAPSLFHHFFFGGRQASPTDRPEHFAHPNTATRLAGVWLKEDAAGEALLRALDAFRASDTRCAPLGAVASRLHLPEGDITFVQSDSPRPILGVTVAVRSLEAAKRLLDQRQVRYEVAACAGGGLWIVAHGLRIELREQP